MTQDWNVTSNWTLNSRKWLCRVSSLKQQVAKVFGLPDDQQILLSADGQSLNPEKSLALYQGDLYLFPKDLLRREELVFDFSLSASAEKLPEEIHTELRELSETQHKLYRSALKADTKLAFFKALQARSQSLLHHCHMLLSASDVVQLNHAKFLTSQKDAFTDFKHRFDQFERYIQWELNEFDLNLETLKDVPLHESLVKEDRKSLGDLLDRSQLITWKNKFIVELTRLREKVKEVEGDVERLEVRSGEIDKPEVGEGVKTEMALRQTEQAVRIYVEYRELLEKYLPERNAAAGRRLFEEQWNEKRLKIKEELRGLEGEEAKMKREFEAQKESCAQIARYFLRIMKTSLSSIAKIRDGVKSQISMLNSLLKRSEQRIQPLLVPKLLPAAYEETLREVSRRFKFLAKADQLRKELLALIDTETNLRSEFLNKYRNVLPQDFIPQLGEAPDRKYLVPRTDNDRNLPKIDVPCSVPPSYFLQVESTDFTEIKTALQIATQENNELTQKDAENKEKIAKLINECDKFRSFSENLEKEIKEKNTQIETETAKNSQFLHKISDFESQKAEFRAKISLLQEELAAKEKSLSELKYRLDVSMESSVNLLESLKLPSQPEAGLAILKEKVTQLRADNYKLRKKLQGTIYFTSFPEGALALFFPDGEGRFVAFHFNSPYHFLDFMSLSDSISQRLRYFLPRQLPFILGKVLQRKSDTASQHWNPFNLPLGTVYHLLVIEADPRFL